VKPSTFGEIFIDLSVPFRIVTAPNGASGTTDIKHAAIGDRAGRR
jgi:hypothetical protein